MILWAAVRAVLLAGPVVFSLSAAVWTLGQSPFTAPLVDAGAEATRRALGVAMAGVVTEEWFDRELTLALAARDLDRVEVVAISAARQGIAPDAGQLEAITALEAEMTGFWVAARDCGLCAYDISACPSLKLMAGCALPVEMTPVGDVNALRRAGFDYLAGDSVDELDLGLALVGLGATALTVATGGTSYTIKAGATVLRVSRRLGTLTPAFAAELARLARLPLRTEALPAFLRGDVGLDAVTDTARLAALGAVAADLGRVVDRTSIVETAHLMRHVETAGDAARLARLSDAAGPDTLRVVEVLGPGRAFRATLRVSDAALAAGVAIWLVAGQVLASLGALLSGRVFRGAARVAGRRANA